MEFKKTVMFLGVKRRVGKNGVGFLVDLYCPGGNHWELYVKDSPENADLVGYLLRVGCGSMVDATFFVDQFQNQTRLRLTGVEDAA